VISVCRYFFEPFASWSWRKELAADAAAGAVALRVLRGADLWHGIPTEAPMSGKVFLTCQGNLIGSDGPLNGTLHDGESQKSGHLLTGIRGVRVAVARCASSSLKRCGILARKYVRLCVS
jgi:hypothetical protein